MLHYQVRTEFACGADATGRRGWDQEDPTKTECIVCKATQEWMEALTDKLGGEGEAIIQRLVTGLTIEQVQALPNDTKGKYPNGFVRTLHEICLGGAADDEMGSVPDYGKYHWRIKMDSLWWIITEDEQGFVSAHGTDRLEHSDRQWQDWTERMIYS